jgi:hypothetical protein
VLDLALQLGEHARGILALLIRFDALEHGRAQLVEALLEIADAHALRAHLVARVSHRPRSPSR